MGCQALHKAHDVGLLAVYLAAVVHDFEHKGVNNGARMHGVCCGRAI